MQTETVAALKRAIDPKALTLGDWIAIAASADVNNSPQWAYYRWVENTSAKLSELKLEEWEAIAVEISYSEQWAYHRYKEQR